MVFGLRPVFPFLLVAPRCLRYSSLVTREKLKSLLAEYGNVALITYLVIWVLTLTGFAIAISTGVNVDAVMGSIARFFGSSWEGRTSGAGLAGLTWLATKLTQPLRIAATVALTPFVASLLRKRRGLSEKPPEKQSV